MNDPRRHHYNPEFYLDEWAGPDGLVCEIKKAHGKVDGPGADFDAALDRLTTAELRDVMLADKLLAGRPLRIDTDNPKTVARAHAWRQCPRDRD